MEIKTKYEVGQEVFFLQRNNVYSSEILEIDIKIKASRMNKKTKRPQRIEITYIVASDTSRPNQNRFFKHEVFATKADLLKSL